MKALTVVRLLWSVAAAELIAWFVNLYLALRQPAVDWRDATAVPLVVVIFLTLALLARARNRLSAESKVSARMDRYGYIAAGLAAAGLVVAFVLGFSTHR